MLLLCMWGQWKRAPCTLKATLDSHTPGQSAELKPYSVKELNPALGYLVTSETRRGTLASPIVKQT